MIKADTAIANYVLCFFIGLLLMAFPAAYYHGKLSEAKAEIKELVHIIEKYEFDLLQEG